jgi:flagellar biosynthesis/type III secretory pathway protein FliH
LFSSADLHNFAPDDKIKYLNDMTTERDIRNQIAFAKDKGFEEGREEGFEDGIEKGREEGRVEERERIVTALRDQGISEEIIAKVSESKR